jgi:hypothetical protein
MKKIISTVVISLFAVSAFAAPKKKIRSTHTARPAATAPAEHRMAYLGSSAYSRPYGLSGCGLGSLVIEKDRGQIWSSTTNYTAFNQLFAISSGTSNCVESPTNAKADRMDKFIVANEVALADDIARGQGETIEGLAQVMNCKDVGALGAKLQSKFASIFTSHDLPANEITDHIITVVGQDEALASECGVSVVSAL